MINEEVSDKTLNLEIKAAKITAKLIIQQIKKLLKEAKKFGGMDKNLEKFKELVKNTIFKDKIKNKQKEQSL